MSVINQMLKDLPEFIKSHKLVIEPANSPIGQIHALVSGDINYACPYESLMLQHALWAANGAGE